MTNESIYTKLTPSAKEALNELSEEYKSSLLERAHKIAAERETASKEISLRDILEAQKNTQVTTEIDKNEYKRKRWTLLLSLSGAVYAAAGILIYLYQNKKFSIENDIGLIIAIVGILVTLIAFLLGQFANRKYISTSNHKDYLRASYQDYEIVKRWQLIEELARKNMSPIDKSEFKSDSVSFLIRFLSHKVAKNEDEFLKIRKLLQARNKIIHEGYKMNDQERNELIKFSDELIQRLEDSQEQTNKSPKPLKIIKATYGTLNKSFDATKELNQLVTNNKLEFVLNNEIVGDPDPGIVKQLNITYSVGDEVKTETYEEGAKVIIQ